MSYPNEMALVKIYDRKAFTLISSVYNGNLSNSGKLDRETQEAILKPKLMLMYNKYMGGVDANDQLLKYSHFNRRTIKWWKKVFFRMLNICMVNAFVLWKEHCNKIGQPYKKTHTDFRISVIKKLITEVAVTRNQNNLHNEDCETLSGKHFLSKIVPSENIKGTQRECRVCCPAEREYNQRRSNVKRQRSGKRSIYECKACDVTLCIDICFELLYQ